MLICVTGIDGCGKSAQIELLSNHLRSTGKNVYVSKAYGAAEKEMFSEYLESIGQDALIFLFQAFHAQQEMRTSQAIKKGQVVIADRWDESYLSYHSQRGVLSRDARLRDDLNNLAFKGIVPDITFLLDVSVQEARRRTDHRGADFFDKKPDSYHKMMRDGYLRLGRKRSWKIVNGEKPVDIIHREIRAVIKSTMRS